jgi:imidazolonepropionase-like amidohydrolase
MAGTDTPHPLLVPGLALQAELRTYEALGLGAGAALATATVAPARFLGREGELGVIAEGAAADLVLLDANPLIDIRNARRIRAVILAGHILDRAALDRLLVEALELAARN